MTGRPTTIIPPSEDRVLQALKRFSPYAVLLLILILAFWFRSNTFWLPHWQGDQSQYVSLAMKLDAKGLTDYNLKGINLRLLNIEGTDGWQLVHPVLADGQEGDLYRAYKMHGLGWYDMPLFYKAPLFPWMLVFFHRQFTVGKHPYLVVKSNLGEKVRHIKPYVFFQAQAWAVAVPLFCSLLTIFLSFFFARRLLGDSETALMAAFLLAVNPVSILSSNHLLADTPLALLVLVSLYFFIIASDKNNLIGIFASGLVGGFAVLTKQGGGFLVLTVWIYTVLTTPGESSGPAAWLRRIFNKRFLAYVFGCVLITGQWFHKIYSVYGTPFFRPAVEQVAGDTSGWQDLLLGRPPAPILFAVGLPYLCPPYAFAYASLNKTWHDVKESFSGSLKGRGTSLFLWAWVLPLVLIFSLNYESREHRYLLPAYPALAMLAASEIRRFRQWLSNFIGPAGYVHSAIWLVLVLLLFWSVPIAWETLYREKFLIQKPF